MSKRKITSLPELDNPRLTINRRKIIQKKYLLNKTYIEFYNRIHTKLNQCITTGDVIELGSGAGFIKKIIPVTKTSDILKIPGIDFSFSAMKMPFKKNSIKAFVMIDVLHHISNTEKFFHEAERCLKPKGKIIMIEPSSTIFGKFIWSNFHHEPHDRSAGWKFKSTGPLSGANSALPWIIFSRDNKIFIKKYPNLSISSIEYHTPLKYLFSGGFTLPQLIPDFFYPGLILLEKLLNPLNKYCGLFMTIVITKKV